MSEYWSTILGERHRYRHRRGQTLISMLEIEPQRKGRRGAEALDDQFRQVVRSDLLAQGLNGWPQAPLAVDFTIITSERQPAAIEKYAKHYQDLLEPRGGSDDLPPHLYSNDRQIKMLFVWCAHTWQSGIGPSLGVTARPRRHVMADLELAGRIGLGPSSGALDAPADSAYASGLRGSAGEPTPFSDWHERYELFERRRARQAQVLTENDHFLSSMLVAAAAPLLRGKPTATARRLSRLGLRADHPMLAALEPEQTPGFLGGLVQVELPPLPTAAGGSKAFRDSVRRAFEEFVDQHEWVTPLLTPLRVTLLVVPPSQGKDLDNIVLAVISALNETLKPHPEPWLLDPALRLPDAKDEQWRVDALARLRQTTDVGVSSYQVIELARTKHDGPSGSLTVALGDGTKLESTWAEIERLVDQWYERDS